MMVGVVVGSCVPLNNTVQSALDAPERDNSSSADDISQGSKKKVVERDVIYLFFLLFKKGGKKSPSLVDHVAPELVP